MSCFISRCKSSQSRRGFTPIILRCGILSSLSLSHFNSVPFIHSWPTAEEETANGRSQTHRPFQWEREGGGGGRRNEQRAQKGGRENVSLRSLKCVEIQDILLWQLAPLLSHRINMLLKWKAKLQMDIVEEVSFAQTCQLPLPPIQQSLKEEKSEIREWRSDYETMFCALVRRWTTTAEVVIDWTQSGNCDSFSLSLLERTSIEECHSEPLGKLERTSDYQHNLMVPWVQICY